MENTCSILIAENTLYNSETKTTMPDPVLSFAYLVNISEVNIDGSKTLLSSVGFQNEKEAKDYFKERMEIDDDFFKAYKFEVEKEKTDTSVLYTLLIDESFKVDSLKRLVELIDLTK